MRQAMTMTALLVVMCGGTPAWAGDVEDCNNAAALIRSEPTRVLGACQRLADQGSADAQFHLGFIYSHGWAVTQSYSQAATWMRKAAEQGEGSAQLFLGRLYLQGQGVSQDYVQAYMWISLAAAQRTPYALADRDAVAHQMSPAQLEQAGKLISAWKPETSK